MIKEKLYNFKGFLFKKNGYIDYTELHSFGLGLMHGVHFKKRNYKEQVNWAAENNEDVEKETHYYELGYFLSNRSKWVAAAVPLGGWLF